jgi:hypothetical protein
VKYHGEIYQIWCFQQHWPLAMIILPVTRVTGMAFQQVRVEKAQSTGPVLSAGRNPSRIPGSSNSSTENSHLFQIPILGKTWILK